MTRYQHAVAYAQMKWPHLAPHSRASSADALATVTPLLTRESGYTWVPQNCFHLVTEKQAFSWGNAKKPSDRACH